MRDQTGARQHAESIDHERKEQVITGDFVRFLRNFSATLKSSKTGNPAMSVALLELAETLRPYSSRHLNDVLYELRGLVHPELKEERTTSIRLAKLELPSLPLESVKSLLDKKELTKKDIIDIGHQRFGIPRSRLERQTKEAVLEAVRIAMKNEESLNIIANEATRQGLRRST